MRFSVKINKDGRDRTMMGKTHYTIGLATALVVLQPESVGECMVALIAGSLGGVTADNDTLQRSHAKLGHLMALKTMLLAIIIDLFFRLGLCESVYENQPSAAIGLIAFVILWLIGYCSDHRTFTHSFIGLLLYSLAAAMIDQKFALGFAVAYLSHLILDVMTRKKLPLLYPFNYGVCLKLCYANKTADKVIRFVGYTVSAILLGRGLILGFSI